jgi:N-methylhydantoinase A
VAVERGRDPRALTLVAFGGAGAMFACEVAEALEMARVLVPPAPGLVCAYGALVAQTARDFAATRLVAAGERLGLAELAAELAPLEAAACAALDEEQVAPERRSIERRIDLRYRGQSYELGVPLAPGRDAVADFHQAHHARFGFADPARPVERVTLRVLARGAAEPAPPLTTRLEPGAGRIGDELFERVRLVPGTSLEGPARIVELSATTFVAPGWRATVDGDGALHLERR